MRVGPADQDVVGQGVKEGRPYELAVGKGQGGEEHGDVLHAWAAVGLVLLLRSVAHGLEQVLLVQPEPRLSHAQGSTTVVAGDDERLSARPASGPTTLAPPPTPPRGAPQGPSSRRCRATLF